ncbi:hypothetical protein JCM10213v2_008525 [Rhodosporidiobolus nylandii]
MRRSQQSAYGSGGYGFGARPDLVYGGPYGMQSTASSPAGGGGGAMYYSQDYLAAMATANSAPANAAGQVGHSYPAPYTAHAFQPRPVSPVRPSPQPWTEVQDRALLAGRDAGMAYELLAQGLGRQVGGCISRWGQLKSEMRVAARAAQIPPPPPAPLVGAVQQTDAKPSKPAFQPFSWTLDKDEKLRELLKAQIKHVQIAHDLGTSRRQVGMRAKQLEKTDPPRAWTEEDTNKLRELKEDGRSVEHISQALCRSSGVIDRRWRKLRKEKCWPEPEVNTPETATGPEPTLLPPTPPHMPPSSTSLPPSTTAFVSSDPVRSTTGMGAESDAKATVKDEAEGGDCKPDIKSEDEEDVKPYIDRERAPSPSLPPPFSSASPHCLHVSGDQKPNNTAFLPDLDPAFPPLPSSAILSIHPAFMPFSPATALLGLVDEGKAAGNGGTKRAAELEVEEKPLMKRVKPEPE